LTDGTAEEYALINAREAAYNRTLHLRVLDAVRALGASERDPGYAVSRLAHSLQSATRAERDGRPVDYVVAALIHDIGDGLAPYSHGSYAAAVLRPFVSEELCWIVSHHPLFQMHYYGAQTGDDVNARDAYQGHPTPPRRIRHRHRTPRTDHQQPPATHHPQRVTGGLKGSKESRMMRHSP
jgi:hypothetical protein